MASEAKEWEEPPASSSSRTSSRASSRASSREASALDSGGSATRGATPFVLRSACRHRGPCNAGEGLHFHSRISPSPIKTSRSRRRRSLLGTRRSRASEQTSSSLQVSSSEGPADDQGPDLTKDPSWRRPDSWQNKSWARQSATKKSVHVESPEEEMISKHQRSPRLKAFDEKDWIWAKRTGYTYGSSPTYNRGWTPSKEVLMPNMARMPVQASFWAAESTVSAPLGFVPRKLDFGRGDGDGSRSDFFRRATLTSGRPPLETEVRRHVHLAISQKSMLSRTWSLAAQTVHLVAMACYHLFVLPSVLLETFFRLLWFLICKIFGLLRNLTWRSGSSSCAGPPGTQPPDPGQSGFTGSWERTLRQRIVKDGNDVTEEKWEEIVSSRHSKAVLGANGQQSSSTAPPSSSAPAWWRLLEFASVLIRPLKTAASVSYYVLALPTDIAENILKSVTTRYYLGKRARVESGSGGDASSDEQAKGCSIVVGKESQSSSVVQFAKSCGSYSVQVLGLSVLYFCNLLPLPFTFTAKLLKWLESMSHNFYANSGGGSKEIWRPRESERSSLRLRGLSPEMGNGLQQRSRRSRDPSQYSQEDHSEETDGDDDHPSHLRPPQIIHNRLQQPIRSATYGADFFRPFFSGIKHLTMLAKFLGSKLVEALIFSIFSFFQLMELLLFIFMAPVKLLVSIFSGMASSLIISSRRGVRKIWWHRDGERSSLRLRGLAPEHAEGLQAKSRKSTGKKRLNYGEDDDEEWTDDEMREDQIYQEQIIIHQSDHDHAYKISSYFYPIANGAKFLGSKSVQALIFSFFELMELLLFIFMAPVKLLVSIFSGMANWLIISSRRGARKIWWHRDGERSSLRLRGLAPEHAEGLQAKSRRSIRKKTQNYGKDDVEEWTDDEMHEDQIYSEQPIVYQSKHDHTLKISSYFYRLARALKFLGLKIAEALSLSFYSLFELLELLVFIFVSPVMFLVSRVGDLFNWIINASKRVARKIWRGRDGERVSLGMRGLSPEHGEGLSFKSSSSSQVDEDGWNEGQVDPTNSGNNKPTNSEFKQSHLCASNSSSMAMSANHCSQPPCGGLEVPVSTSSLLLNILQFPIVATKKMVGTLLSPIHHAFNMLNHSHGKRAKRIKVDRDGERMSLRLRGLSPELAEGLRVQSRRSRALNHNHAEDADFSSDSDGAEDESAGDDGQSTFGQGDENGSDIDQLTRSSMTHGLKSWAVFLWSLLLFPITAIWRFSTHLSGAMSRSNSSNASTNADFVGEESPNCSTFHENAENLNGGSTKQVKEASPNGPLDEVEGSEDWVYQTEEALVQEQTNRASSPAISRVNNFLLTLWNFFSKSSQRSHAARKSALGREGERNSLRLRGLPPEQVEGLLAKSRKKNRTRASNATGSSGSDDEEEDIVTDVTFVQQRSGQTDSMASDQESLGMAPKDHALHSTTLGSTVLETLKVVGYRLIQLLLWLPKRLYEILTFKYLEMAFQGNTKRKGSQKVKQGRDGERVSLRLRGLSAEHRGLSERSRRASRSPTIQPDESRFSDDDSEESAGDNNTTGGYLDQGFTRRIAKEGPQTWSQNAIFRLARPFSSALEYLVIFAKTLAASAFEGLKWMGSGVCFVFMLPLMAIWRAFQFLWGIPGAVPEGSAKRSRRQPPHRPCDESGFSDSEDGERTLKSGALPSRGKHSLLAGSFLLDYFGSFKASASNLFEGGSERFAELKRNGQGFDKTKDKRNKAAVSWCWLLICFLCGIGLLIFCLTPLFLRTSDAAAPGANQAIGDLIMPALIGACQTMTGTLALIYSFLKELRSPLGLPDLAQNGQQGHAQVDVASKDRMAAERSARLKAHRDLFLKGMDQFYSDLLNKMEVGAEERMAGLRSQKGIQGTSPNHQSAFWQEYDQVKASIASLHQEYSAALVGGASTADLAQLNKVTDDFVGKVEAAEKSTSLLRAELLEAIMRQRRALDASGDHQVTTDVLEAFAGTLVNLEEFEAALESLTTAATAPDDVIHNQVVAALDRLRAALEHEEGSQGNSLLARCNISEIQKAVGRHLVKYDADRTGLFDYVLETSGGWVVSTRCTQPYKGDSSHRTILWGLIRLDWFWWPFKSSKTSPRKAIQAGIQPGECWAFKGSEGRLVLGLSVPMRPKQFSLEHISRSQSPDGKVSSAPREFEVYGLMEERDGRPQLLGSFVYDGVQGPPLQMFEAQDPDESGPAFKMVELAIKSNHGNPAYTCLYRFRVHGSSHNGRR